MNDNDYGPIKAYGLAVAFATLIMPAKETAVSLLPCERQLVAIQPQDPMHDEPQSPHRTQVRELVVASASTAVASTPVANTLLIPLGK